MPGIGENTGAQGVVVPSTKGYSMGSISPFHWLVVILIIVLLFGSKKIPDLAKHLGQGLKEFKKASTEAEKEAELPAAKTDALEKPEKKDDAKA
jgi:sec-independent protein translocase protein TatA